MCFSYKSWSHIHCFKVYVIFFFMFSLRCTMMRTRSSWYLWFIIIISSYGWIIVGISFLKDKLHPYWGLNKIFHHMKCIKRLGCDFSWVIYKSMHFFYQQISIQMGKIWVAIFVFTLCKSNLRYIERMCGNFLLLLDTIHIS